MFLLRPIKVVFNAVVPKGRRLAPAVQYRFCFHLYTHLLRDMVLILSHGENTVCSPLPVPDISISNSLPVEFLLKVLKRPWSSEISKLMGEKTSP